MGGGDFLPSRIYMWWCTPTGIRTLAPAMVSQSAGTSSLRREGARPPRVNPRSFVVLFSSCVCLCDLFLFVISVFWYLECVAEGGRDLFPARIYTWLCAPTRIH